MDDPSTSGSSLVIALGDIPYAAAGELDIDSAEETSGTRDDNAAGQWRPGKVLIGCLS